MRLIPFLAALSLATPALADEGAWASYVGGGAAVRANPSELSAAAGVLLESTYGLTHRLNVESLFTADVRRGVVGLLGGGGLEYVVYRTNHLRWNVGLGVAVRVPLVSQPPIEVGPLVETALRWTFTWAVGLAVSIHGAYLFELRSSASALHVAPSLALYLEL